MFEFSSSHAWTTGALELSISGAQCQSHLQQCSASNLNPATVHSKTCLIFDNTDSDPRRSRCSWSIGELPYHIIGFSYLFHICDNILTAAAASASQVRSRSASRNLYTSPFTGHPYISPL